MKYLLLILLLLAGPTWAATKDKDGCFPLDQILTENDLTQQVPGMGAYVVENAALINKAASKMSPEERKQSRWCPLRVEGLDGAQLNIPADAKFVPSRAN